MAIIAAAGTPIGFSTIHAYFGRGDETFGAPLGLTALDSAGVAVGDLDVLRGIDDLAHATTSTIPLPPGTVVVDAAPINADADSALELVIARTSRVFIADLDHDGVDDVVVADDLSVHILHGNRDAVGIGAMCGDGTLDLEEMCDDGNNIDGDGCSASCTVEVCGNGILDHGEQCDDGNIVSGDGCSATCQVEL